MSLNRPVLGSSEEDDRETPLPTAPDPRRNPRFPRRHRSPGLQGSPARNDAYQWLEDTLRQLGYLRHGAGYQRRRRHLDKTRPSPIRLGERRKPFPEGRPGFLRVDSIHRGDQDGIKGLYHIHAVDEVTQMQVIVCVERISERYMLPALEQLLAAFPPVILKAGPVRWRAQLQPRRQEGQAAGELRS
ncbi:MAG: hypothetical protein ACK5HY_06065 [Parahaliea sp.]